MNTWCAIGHMGERSATHRLCKPPEDYIHEASGLISKFLCKKSFGSLVRFTCSFPPMTQIEESVRREKILKKMPHLRDQNVGLGCPIVDDMPNNIGFVKDC